MMHGLLSDGHNGTLSSKRVVTFLAFLLCAVAFIANLFWGFEVKQFMYDSMIYLTMVGLGVTAAEKFAPINKETKKGLL
jgi:hypothetical protein